jgi:hypothetical protein
VFSVCTNGKKLLNTDASGDTLHAIHGIRFITICWVVLGHRYTVDVGVPSINLLIFPDVSKKEQNRDRERMYTDSPPNMPAIPLRIITSSTFYSSAYSFLFFFFSSSSFDFCCCGRAVQCRNTVSETFLRVLYGQPYERKVPCTTRVSV